MKKEEQDVYKEISNLKIYVAILAIIVVVLGIYVVAGAVGFSGMKGNVGGKAYAVTTGGTGTLYVDETKGYVGIGTGSTPPTKLSLKADGYGNNIFQVYDGASKYLRIGPDSIWLNGSSVIQADSISSLYLTAGNMVWTPKLAIGSSNPPSDAQLRISGTGALGSDGIKITHTAFPTTNTTLKATGLQVISTGMSSSVFSSMIQVTDGTSTSQIQSGFVSSPTIYLGQHARGSSCIAGAIVFDTGHFYGCTVANTWKLLDS